MWQNMCPAQVYEVPDEELEAGNDEVKLQITPSNCVQCGAITAKGGRLTPPEGGDGPNYQPPDDALSNDRIAVLPWDPEGSRRRHRLHHPDRRATARAAAEP